MTTKKKNIARKATAYLSILAFLLWSTQMFMAAVLQLKTGGSSFWVLIPLVLFMQVLFLLFFSFMAKFNKYERKRIGLFKNRLWISGLLGLLVPVFQLGQQYTQQNMDYYPAFWFLGLVSLYLLYRHIPALMKRQEARN